MDEFALLGLFFFALFLRLGRGVWVGLGLSKFLLLMALMLFYIVLGKFIDGFSGVVLTMAHVQPMLI